MNVALRVLLLVTLLLPGLAMAAQNDAVRAFPPSWWVGMKNPDMQLLVSGPGIGADALSVELPEGVVRIGDRALASPNYRVVDLRIEPAAKAGDIVLRFTGSNGERRVLVPLATRRPGSAEREGFGPKDAILNLMPDRFANGDPSNDRVPGMLEAAELGNGAARQGGDIAGLANSLDYIAGMGFTMVWPTPVVENNQPAFSYHGYAITDLYRVDPRFGSNE
ncbi:MAG: cyclomaltodextrinase N-terminal domain-containing protein, partial [Lysobacteraceae bacterium]